MSYDLTRFGLEAMALCAAGLRSACAAGAQTMESRARALCRYLYGELTGPDGESACVLVRCYVTHPYGGLPHDLQRFAKRAFGAVAITPPEPTMKCLVLLATAGDEPAWNDRRASQGHQAIPLPSPHIVERAPMIAQLIRELGLDIAKVVRPTGLVHHLGGGRQGVFHVEQAAGSPYIPAQSGFVDRYGIRSVLGFGGTLPSGELFAIILFARIPIRVDTADRFRTLAADVRGCLTSGGDQVFDEAASAVPSAPEHAHR